MNRPIRHVAFAVFIGLGAILTSLSFIQVIDADRYRDDPRNVRASISRSGKERGFIFASDGLILARSRAVEGEPQLFLREYPGGEAFSHVVGYSSLLFGDEGLEAAYAEELRSRRDLTISDLLSALLGRDLRPKSIMTTIDPDLQRVAFEALGDQRGAIVALDPSTGRVLAMVSTPSYNADLLVGVDAAGVREELVADPDRPLLDRTSRHTYTPGSTFKTIVTGTAIETGEAEPRTEFPDPPFFPLPGSDEVLSNAHGGSCNDGESITLAIAFARSCNTVFAQLSIDVGAEALGQVADAFGFNRDIPFDWNVLNSVFPAESLTVDPAALAMSGIGERDVQATALQMAMVAAGMANDGLVMNPFVVERIVDADGLTVDQFDPIGFDQPVSPASALLTGLMMERVITEGTGSRAAVPGFRVGGKTGTAERTGGAPDVWFIAFAPIGDPSIALAVVIEEGGVSGEVGTGGTIAAPVAQQVLAYWLANNP